MLTRSTAILAVAALLTLCSCDSTEPDGPPDEACTPCNGEPLPGCSEACSPDPETSKAQPEDEDGEP